MGGNTKLTHPHKTSSGKYGHGAVMEDEIVSAAMAIAENPNMSLDEINFRRGSIFAAKALLDMPTRLKSKLYGEVALNKDDTAAQPLA